jgi:hypothetical protein
MKEKSEEEEIQKEPQPHGGEPVQCSCHPSGRSPEKNVGEGKGEGESDGRAPDNPQRAAPGSPECPQEPGIDVVVRAAQDGDDDGDDKYDQMPADQVRTRPDIVPRRPGGCPILITCSSTRLPATIPTASPYTTSAGLSARDTQEDVRRSRLPGMGVLAPDHMILDERAPDRVESAQAAS